MSTATQPVGGRGGTAPDPHIVELGKLMLARAPGLGKAMADLLCREIDAYHDGSVVAKDQVAESCVANVTFIFDSLAGNADVDVSPAERTGTARAVAGVPLPAVMTAYRIGFRFMWEQTIATARAAAIPTDSILDATARVFLAQDIFTQAMSAAYRQQVTAQLLEREEERSALVEALLYHRISDSQSLWEAADLLRLPTSGPYVIVAAELPAIGKLALPTIENKLSIHDIRSAWRLLPDIQVGIVHLRGHASRPRQACRGAPQCRYRASRHQSAVPRTDRHQRRVAIRPAGGGREAVGRVARRCIRRHAACHSSGQRACGHGEDQVVAAGAAGRTARRRTHCAA